VTREQLGQPFYRCKILRRVKRPFITVKRLDWLEITSPFASVKTVLSPGIKRIKIKSFV
jgi:hypothetical protein